MKIGLPKEIKDNEYRVGLTPAGVNALSNAGHEVFVQKTAGEGSGFPTSFMSKRAAHCSIRRTKSGRRAI